MTTPENEPNVPDRPAPPPFSSSLPEIEPLPRPRIVLVVAGLVAVAAIVHVWLTFVGLTDSSRIRAELVKELSKEATDFSKSDVRKAVNVIFGVANGVGVLLLLWLIHNVNGLLSRRASGRTGFTVLTLLFLPVAVTNMLLRLGEGDDLVGTGVVCGALLLAVALSFAGSVSAWLHQLERTHRISMDPASRYVKDQATSD